MMTQSPRLRLGVFGVTIVSLFAAMFARLWYLQVVASPVYRVQADGNRVRLITEEAPRGRILDRQGRVLVDNRVSNSVVIRRNALVHRDQVLVRLAALLGVPISDLERRLDDPRGSLYKPVAVADDVPKEKLVYIREHQAEFPGVDGVQLKQRTYPHGRLAAHVLGYVGEINGRELAGRKSEGYKLGDSIGKAGIEQAYEDELRGQSGIEKLEVDSRGKVLRSLGYQRPSQGHDVQLTIDLDVQAEAEESLVQGLQAARKAWDGDFRKHFLAPAGSVVVLDPRDGSVLAMASHPDYEPASFINGIRTDVFRAMNEPGSYYPLNNRAIQGLYAPGSTFKLVTAAAALSRGLITPATTVHDTGSMKVGKQVFRNARGRAHGNVDLVQALLVSSDVYFYQLGAQFWNERGRFGDAIQEVAHGLGLGNATGIPLRSEASGRIPDPEVRRRLHESNPQGFPNGKWFTGDNVNLSIGQGEVVVTPLQLANAYATFANGGTVFEPQVASAVLDGNGNKLRDVPRRSQRTVPLPASVRDPILHGLVGAVADPRGTAVGAFFGFPLATFPVAGKTGTAQVFGKQDTSLFSAFAPANDPRYVVTVVMEESGFGSSAAAPVARRVLESLAGLTPNAVAVVEGGD